MKIISFQWIYHCKHYNFWRRLQYVGVGLSKILAGLIIVFSFGEIDSGFYSAALGKYMRGAKIEKRNNC